MNMPIRSVSIHSFYGRRILKSVAAVLLTAVFQLPAVAGDETVGNKRLPAFPGAEGFGMFSRGGRDGKVYVVNNLDGRGPGSLREAVDAEGPRIVVFAVGGTIDLGGPLPIRNPYCTIAGQTAPGGGITLKNGSLIPQANHLIVRYIRCRLGEQAGAPGAVDAVSIYHPLDKDDPDRPVASNIILDHVSASWGTDEVLSVTGSVDNVTVQWSIVSEGVTTHNCGSLLRPSVECHMSFHHNLYAHNRSRNPFAGSYRDQANHCDWRNNVIYNGGDGHGGTNWHKLYPDRWGPENVGRLRLNCVNNYWIRGPQGSGTIYRGGDQATIYQSGNLLDDTNNGILDGVDKGWTVFANYHEKARFTRATEEFSYPQVITDSAEVALERVLSEAGASKPQRDAVDRRLVQDVRTGKGKVIRTVAEVGGWPELAPGTAPVDSDQDGMPDAWEKTHGLNPVEAGDSRLDPDNDGYANIEEYLNETDPTRYVDYWVTVPE
jgi:pectate lyase